LKTKVSFIITIFNNSKYLERCLNSIIKQTKKPDEIIIIDDGSYNTNYILKITKFNSWYNKIFFFKNSVNRGPSFARNLGVKKSSYDYICFIDVDDELMPKYLSNKIDALKKITNHQKLFGIFSNSLIKNNKKISKTNYTQKETLLDANLVGKYSGGISGRSIEYIFVKKNLIKVGLYDEDLKINEDFDLIIRSIRSGLILKNIKSYDTIINHEKNSLTRNDNFKKNYTKEMVFLKKAQKRNYFSKKELISRFNYIELKLLKNLALKDFQINLITNFFLNYYKFLKSL
jgi:glycosyltransferase involved in cell wall biosynthesis